MPNIISRRASLTDDNYTQLLAKHRSDRLTSIREIKKHRYFSTMCVTWFDPHLPSHNLTVTSLETGTASLCDPVLRLGNHTSCPPTPSQILYQRRSARRRTATPTAVPGMIHTQTFLLTVLLHVWKPNPAALTRRSPSLGRSPGRAKPVSGGAGSVNITARRWTRGRSSGEAG